MNDIKDIVEDIRLGKMVILVDDEDRENEGDIIIAAEHITPAAINFMACEARGLICLALPENQIRNLGIPLMVRDDFNNSPNKTAFTVSIEAAHGVSTGISAADRSQTVKVAVNPNAGPQDITMPGHVFPIQGQAGGVLKRAGHTEASIDLSTLAGLNPSAVICEIMNPDGTMARVPQLKEFAKKHDIKIGTIEDLIQYRIENDIFVEEVAASSLPSFYGQGFQIRVFTNRLDGREHIALVKGEIDGDTPTLVRVHSECVVGDVFGSLRTPSGDFLKAAMRQIDQHGSGVILYLRTEDMENRLIDRVKNYAKMDQGLEVESITKSYDQRNYGLGAQILRQLGVRKLKLLTNNPSKRVGIKGYGLEVVDSAPLDVTLPEDLSEDVVLSSNTSKAGLDQ